MGTSNYLFEYKTRNNKICRIYLFRASDCIICLYREHNICVGMVRFVVGNSKENLSDQKENERRTRTSIVGG